MRAQRAVVEKPRGRKAKPGRPQGIRMMGTALIVEDHPEQADLVARILRLRDYEAILAETVGDDDTTQHLVATAVDRQR